MLIIFREGFEIQILNLLWPTGSHLKVILFFDGLVLLILPSNPRLYKLL